MLICEPYSYHNKTKDGTPISTTYTQSNHRK